MQHGNQFAKWMELRLKTDRDLVHYFFRTLAAGVRNVMEAAESGAPEPCAHAWNAYEEVVRLLPCLRETGHAERRQIGRELAHLHRLLRETEISPAQARAAC